MRLSEQNVPEENRPALRRPGLFAANALYLLAAAGLAVAPWALPPLTRLMQAALPALSPEALLLAATLLYYIPCLAWPCLHYARTRRVWAGMRFVRPLSPAAAIYSVMAAVVCLPLGAYIAILWSALLKCLGLALTETAVYIPTTTRGLIVAVFYLGVVPGVCEELAFRGLVLGAWERRGSGTALLVSSLLFASLHGSLLGFPTQFVLGLALVALALGSGSIYAGMLFHTLYNSLIVISEYTVENLLAPTEAELAGADAAATLGGWSGALHTGLDALLLGAVLLFLLYRVRRRGAREGVTLVPRTAGRLTASELLVLISGGVTVLYLYGVNLLEMLGVIG